MLLCLGEPPRRFLLLLYLRFIFDLHFVVVSSFVDFRHSHLLFRHHRSPFRGLLPGFYTHFILSAQPIVEWFAILSFSTFPLSSCRERYGFKWAFFTHRRFLPYGPSPTFLTQPTFILRLPWEPAVLPWNLQGFITDPWNTDPAYLFVLFTVTHKLQIPERFMFIFYHMLEWITCGKKFRTLFACSKYM